MARVFNISAVRWPKEHYMVNIEKSLKEITALADEGKYFTVNRARQILTSKKILYLNR